MIQKNTVLVLGAGASRPYGFPTGFDLFKQVTPLANGASANHHLGIWLLTCGFKEEEIRNFASKLRYSPHNSVDAFLEHWPKFEEIGKAAIIGALIPSENPETPFDLQTVQDQEHWYRYLFQRMGGSFKEFQESKLSVVTFNYDRSLEYYLSKALESSYDKPLDECKRAVKEMPIVHVHGQIGTYLNEGNDASLFREYNREISEEIIRPLIPQIKIVSETTPLNNPAFSEASELLIHSELICFLGFAYDQRNVRRLFQLDEEYIFGKAKLMGSAFGLTSVEQHEINQRLFGGKISMGHEEYNNLEYLRRFGVLLNQ